MRPPLALPPTPRPPAVIKPLADMRPIAVPAPPIPLSQLPAKDQAHAAYLLYQEMAKTAAQCIVQFDGLVSWINRQP